MTATNSPSPLASRIYLQMLLILIMISPSVIALGEAPPHVKDSAQDVMLFSHSQPGRGAGEAAAWYIGRRLRACPHGSSPNGLG